MFSEISDLGEFLFARAAMVFLRFIIRITGLSTCTALCTIS
jgi:hypothetical protein